MREAAPALKAGGHPIGIGLADDADSNVALLSLLMCFGASIQDEAGALTIDSERTVEAVAFMAELQAQGGESGAFDWDVTSNNQHVLSGRGSLIVNAISPIRRAEELGMSVADDLWIWPMPQGPGGRLGLAQYTGVYSVWRFAKNREAAERFLGRRLRRIERGDSRVGLLQLPEFPGRASRQADLQDRRRRSADAEGQVLDPHDRGVALHAQRRISRTRERCRPGNPRPVPHPADVRAGCAGTNERR